MDKINALGIKFGLWIEPEMISQDSNLAREHPEFYLHVPGRPSQLGRNQMILDISNHQVVDKLFDMISTLLSSCNIEYLKWDMNRCVSLSLSLSLFLSASLLLYNSC